MHHLKKTLCLPLLLALTFTAGVAPAGAEQDEEPPGWPPKDTGGRYVPVASAFYDAVQIKACGTTVRMTSGDVREVEEKVTVRRDGRVVIKYRGGSTVDLERASDKAFIDELDVSGPVTERWSADQTDLSISLRGASIIWPLSPNDAEAIEAAGLPEFSYFEKGRLTFELTFSDGPTAEPDVEITRNAARHVKDVCEMLDKAAK